MDDALFKRLALDHGQQVYHIAVRAYLVSREMIFERVPEIRSAYQHCSESKENDDSLQIVEMFMSALASLNRLKNVGDCTQECRDTLDALLSFICGHGASWMLSPNLLDWIFVDALIAERRALGKGLRRIFKSKEFTMLDRLVSDYQSGISLTVLQNRLKVIEDHGVFFNPKLYQLLAIRSHRILAEN